MTLLRSCLAYACIIAAACGRDIWQLPKHVGIEHAIFQQATSSRDAFISNSNLMPWLRENGLGNPRRVPSTDADDIVFVVMASMAERDRVAGQRSSWMRWAKHTVILADGEDNELGIMTLPEIGNKSGFAEAQWRQLHGMKWLLNARPDLLAKRWFFLVDDDTWVNMPVLVQFTSKYPCYLPLSFSHIYLMYGSADHRHAVYNGGAGMLFTSAAFRLIANAVLTPTCPLGDVDPNFMNNDNILAACAHRVGVLKISSSRFSTYEGVLHLKDDIIDTSWLDQITVHKVTDPAMSKSMYCWSDKSLGRVNSYCK